MINAYDRNIQYVMAYIKKELFASGNFEENNARKVCNFFAESYFRYIKFSMET